MYLMLAGLPSCRSVYTNCWQLSCSCCSGAVACVLAAGLPQHSCGVAAVGKLACVYVPGVVALAAGSQLHLGLAAVCAGICLKATSWVCLVLCCRLGWQERYFFALCTAGTRDESYTSVCGWHVCVGTALRTACACFEGCRVVCCPDVPLGCSFVYHAATHLKEREVSAAWAARA